MWSQYADGESKHQNESNKEEEGRTTIRSEYAERFRGKREDAVEVSNIYDTLNVEEVEQREDVKEKIERKFNNIKESIIVASKNVLSKKKKKANKE